MTVSGDAQRDRAASATRPSRTDIETLYAAAVSASHSADRDEYRQQLARAAARLAAWWESSASDRENWLAGYRWALEHLTDEAVLRDAAEYARELAEVKAGPGTSFPPAGADEAPNKAKGAALPDPPASAPQP